MKLSPQTILNVLLVFVPMPIIGKWLDWPSLFIFLTACLGIVPLAGLMGKATETLADRLGAGPGGLLNATFGNACELLIALSALRAGLIDVVKASITGSIIGNILLVLGFAMLAGGLKYKTQYFNRTAATTSATLLALAAVCLVVPTVFHYSGPAVSHDHEDDLALAISAVQMTVYFLSLYFSLKTHKSLYVREVDHEVHEAMGTTGWGMKISVAVLFGATIMVAILSECLVGEVEHTASTFGMSQLFIGVILVAIIGNAAEHSTAILMAMKNKMDLSINIALGSSSQIALFVAPVIVFASFIMGKPMNLVFSEFEVMSVVVSVFILPFVATDGECNWLEGVQLLAVYAVLGLTFFLI
ncbi:MAG: calcium/proton exchanger [Candidatus Obscuribacterales bacterium]|nr:calcium/proton exchanger [Candidatus Obscuribacterales bacterium]